MAMGKRLLLGFAAVVLAGATILTALWWTLLFKADVPDSGRVLTFLVGLAAIHVASIAVLACLLLRIRRIDHLGWLLCATVLCVGLGCSSLLNGFTPALGGLIALLVTAVGCMGVVATGRLTTS